MKTNTRAEGAYEDYDELEVYQTGASTETHCGGTLLPDVFAVDIRMACLPRQGVPLLSVYDLDRALKTQGGYAEVYWGEHSGLYVGNGQYDLEVPLAREGADIEVRGDTGLDGAFRVDPNGAESVIVDTGAAISCCGPDCAFLKDTADAPPSLRLVGANKSPLPVLKVGRFRLVFGASTKSSFGASFVALGYAEPEQMAGYEPSVIFHVAGVGVALPNDKSIPPLLPALQGVRALHSRFGIVDPRVFERIHEVTVGVDRVGKRARDRFFSLSYVRAAQQRTQVSSVSAGSHRQLAAPGMRCSLDLTRRFSPYVDG